mgnify:CR=1 FL=1
MTSRPSATRAPAGCQRKAHKFSLSATARWRSVAESENEFLREFEALLRGGLDVDVRPSDEWRRANGSRATVEHALLSLGTDTRGRARCAWTAGERDTAFLVAEMRCVARPLPAELGELSARSFIVQHDGDARDGEGAWWAMGASAAGRVARHACSKLQRCQRYNVRDKVIIKMADGASPVGLF